MTRFIKYGQQDNEIRNLLQDYKQKSEQYKNNKFSMSFSDCSAVLENGSRRNSNLCDTNEVSWLEKLSENDNRAKNKCNPHFNEQVKPFYQSKYLLLEGHQKQEMSSNRKYKIDQQIQREKTFFKPPLANDQNSIDSTFRKESNNIITVLRDIQNTEPLRRVNITVQKKKVVGSIKRNRVDSHIQNKILHQQFFENDVDLQELEKVRMSKLQEMNEKLNKVLHISSNQGKCEYQFSKQSSSRLSSKRPLKQNLTNVPNRAITKDKQQLSKRQFARSSSQALKVSIQPQKCKNTSFADYVTCLEKMFDILDSKNESILSKSNCNVEQISQEFKFIFGCIFTRIFLKQLTCTKRQFVKLCQKTLKQIDSDEILDLLRLFTDRYLSNHQIKKDNTDFQDKTNRCNNKNRSITKIVKNSIIDIYQSSNQQADRVQFNKHTAFRPHSNSVSKPFFSNRIHQTQLASVYASKPNHFESTVKIGRNHCNSNSQHFTLNKIDISESMIQEHKQNLKEISDLDKMVQNCLTSKSYNPFGVGQQDQSLRFDQLVKHI